VTERRSSAAEGGVSRPVLVDPVTPWRNWSRAESSTPAFRARPTSVEEVVAVIAAARERGLAV
jgi:hypothetical protein